MFGNPREKEKVMQRCKKKMSFLPSLRNKVKIFCIQMNILCVHLLKPGLRTINIKLYTFASLQTVRVSFLPLGKFWMRHNKTARGNAQHKYFHNVSRNDIVFILLRPFACTSHYILAALGWCSSLKTADYYLEYSRNKLSCAHNIYAQGTYTEIYQIWYTFLCRPQ